MTYTRPDGAVMVETAPHCAVNAELSALARTRTTGSPPLERAIAPARTKGSSLNDPLRPVRRRVVVNERHVRPVFDATPCGGRSTAETYRDRTMFGARGHGPDD